MKRLLPLLLAAAALGAVPAAAQAPVPKSRSIPRPTR